MYQPLGQTLLHRGMLIVAGRLAVKIVPQAVFVHPLRRGLWAGPDRLCQPGRNIGHRFSHRSFPRFTAPQCRGLSEAAAPAAH
jgi:hypothetical protein